MEVGRLVQLLAMMQTDQACTPSDRSHVHAGSSKFSRRMIPKKMHRMALSKYEE